MVLGCLKPEQGVCARASPSLGKQIGSYQRARSPPGFAPCHGGPQQSSWITANLRHWQALAGMAGMAGIFAASLPAGVSTRLGAIADRGVAGHFPAHPGRPAREMAKTDAAACVSMHGARACSDDDD